MLSRVWCSVHLSYLLSSPFRHHPPPFASSSHLPFNPLFTPPSSTPFTPRTPLTLHPPPTHTRTTPQSTPLRQHMGDPLSGSDVTSSRMWQFGLGVEFN
jgi:hypothetical protein